MQCPKCKGNVIKKDGIFECENCGAHFKGKSKKEEAEKVEEAPIITEPKEEYTEPSEPFYDVSKEFKQESDPFDVKESKEYAPENDVYEAPKYDNSSSPHCNKLWAKQSLFLYNTTTYYNRAKRNILWLSKNNKLHYRRFPVYPLA